MKHMSMKKLNFLGSATISERGQVVIPQEAREKLNLEKGEKLLVFDVNEKGILLTKVNTFEEMAAKMSEKNQEINEIVKKVK